ncbi:hypothetical protein Tco_0816823 [Tanacetum coccineum]
MLTQNQTHSLVVVARCGRGCEGQDDEGGEAMVLAVATVVVSVVMAEVVLWWAAVGRQPEEGLKKYTRIDLRTILQILRSGEIICKFSSAILVEFITPDSNSGFLRLALPLTKLMRKGEKFVWRRSSEKRIFSDAFYDGVLAVVLMQAWWKVNFLWPTTAKALEVLTILLMIGILASQLSFALRFGDIPLWRNGFWASLRVEPNLISQIKAAQKDDGEIWAIIQNIDQQDQSVNVFLRYGDDEVTNEKVAVAREKLKEAKTVRELRRRHRRALDSSFIGSCEILDRVGEVSYRLAVTPQAIHLVHNVFQRIITRGQSHEEQDDPFCQNPLEESSRAGSYLGDRGVYTDFLSSFSSMICSSPVKTSEILEEFADELTLLKKVVQEENFQVYSNPLFEFDDNLTSSNENSLFNEIDEDVENKNSNVLDSDELVLLNTPLSDKVECSDPEDKIDEIDTFLAMEVSSNFEEGYFDSEGDIIFLENLLSDYTTHNLAPEVILDHEPKQDESIQYTSITFSPRNDPLHHEFAGELLTLPSRIVREHEDYLSRMTLLCEISISRSQENVHPSSIPIKDSDHRYKKRSIYILVPDE